MTGGKGRNLAASVRQRLLELSRARPGLGDFTRVLTQYAIERVLFRLSRSAHRDRFVLKGAQLFSLWLPFPHRPTRDLDLLGRGDNSPAVLEEVFVAVLATPVPDDGLTFDPRVRAEVIQRQEEYLGVRLRLVAALAAARIPVQVDIGYGDAVTPPPVLADFPTLLGAEAPRLLAYPREAMVAEKLEAMLSLGAGNTRMKDFFDVRALAAAFSFDGLVLQGAIEATLARRGVRMTNEPPLPLTAAFAAIEGKETQWRAFLRKASLEDSATLAETCSGVGGFLLPLLRAVAEGVSFELSWAPGGPWR